MFRAQMKFQKIVTFAVLVVAALVFVYGLGFMTSIHSMLYFTLDSSDPLYSIIEGGLIYYELNGLYFEGVKTAGFNDYLVALGIALLLIAVFQFVMHTNSRRKYYIGNYVSTALVFVSFVFAAVWIMAKVTYYKAEYLKVDFVALEEYCKILKRPFTTSTLAFDLGYVFGAVLIVMAALAVVNLIWKKSLEKRENILLSNSKKEDAVNA